MLINLVVIFISFLVGYAMKRGGLCTYAAVVQIVNDRRVERLGVAAWATFIILPLHWLYPTQITLSSTHNELLIALIGGAVLGFGAYLNRGCFFGTFVALVSGNINYIATLFGLSAGIVFTHFYLFTVVPSTLSTSVVSVSSTGAYIWLTLMIAFTLFMLFSMKQKKIILKISNILFLTLWIDKTII